MESTPQTEPLRDARGAPRTVANSAGGQAFAVNDAERLRRFLVLGSDGGTYYATPRAHTEECMASVVRMIAAGRGEEVVATIREVSTEGRAPRQTPALAALALCAATGPPAVRAAAHAALPAIARIPTHLFEYLDLYEAAAKAARGGATGWGRAQRRSVARWYNGHRGGSAPALARSVTKYQRRGGWSHLDALRLSHSKPADPAHALVFAYIAKGPSALDRPGPEPEPGGEPEPGLEAEAELETRAYLRAVAAMRRLGPTPEGEAAAVDLIARHCLVREHVPSALLSSRKVWAALLEDMPMTALIRNLGKLTSIGLLAPGAPATRGVVARLGDREALRRARVHPVAVLTAHRAYLAGRGDKGSVAWTPVEEVTAALDRGFELAFHAVVPAHKRTLLALDVSGSMSAGCNGAGYSGGGLTCAEASAAMALIAMRTEPECTAMCFSHEFRPYPLTKTSSLEDAVAGMGDWNFGATDCALPMRYATEHGLKVETFIVYTDSETYYGAVHPREALRSYRASSGIHDAKLVVVGMASNGFSIADPADPGMLDVVGFDAATPQVMTAFAAGRV